MTWSWLICYHFWYLNIPWSFNDRFGARANQIALPGPSYSSMFDFQMEGRWKLMVHKRQLSFPTNQHKNSMLVRDFKISRWKGNGSWQLDGCCWLVRHICGHWKNHGHFDGWEMSLFCWNGWFTTQTAIDTIVTLEDIPPQSSAFDSRQPMEGCLHSVHFCLHLEAIRQIVDAVSCLWKVVCYTKCRPNNAITQKK